MRCYFYNDDAYFQSPKFGKVLSYVQSNQKQCRLKDVKGRFMLIIEGVSSIENAMNHLNHMVLEQESTEKTLI